MRRWKSSLLIFLMTALALAQDAGQRRAGARIACLCGSCSATLANCPMLECGFGKPAKEKVFQMQQAGLSDAAIIDSFIKEHGQQIYRAEPSIMGLLTPYLAILPGLALIWWFMRRYYRPRPAGSAPVAPPPSRYDEQIEKELSQLD